jgi:hypothetical protein
MISRANGNQVSFKCLLHVSGSKVNQKYLVQVCLGCDGSANAAAGNQKRT